MRILYIVVAARTRFETSVGRSDWSFPVSCLKRRNIDECGTVKNQIAHVQVHERSSWKGFPCTAKDCIVGNQLACQSIMHGGRYLISHPRDCIVSTGYESVSLRCICSSEFETGETLKLPQCSGGWLRPKYAPAASESDRPSFRLHSVVAGVPIS